MSIKATKTHNQHMEHLAGSIRNLKNDLADEASKAGFDNVLQRWIEDLKDDGRTEFHPLVQDMQQLKAHMHAGAYDPEIIAPLLSRMGDHTRAVAKMPEDFPMRERMTFLAEALDAAAVTVRQMSMARPD